MIAEVKKCADSHDIKGLRYIFVDCLDVDPTFEKYKSDYEYCKPIDGLIEPHQDLNGLIFEQNKWNRDYWEQLKLDLMKNFSEKRFEHMIIVAKVVYSDKIDRLIKERNTRNVSVEQKNKKVVPDVVQKKEVVGGYDKVDIGIEKPVETLILDEDDKQRIQEKQREIAEHNRKVAEEQNAIAKKIASGSRTFEKQNKVQGNSGSKKWLGVVLTIVAIIIVVLVIIMLQGNNPQ